MIFFLGLCGFWIDGEDVLEMSMMFELSVERCLIFDVLVIVLFF